MVLGPKLRPFILDALPYIPQVFLWLFDFYSDEHTDFIPFPGLRDQFSQQRVKLVPLYNHGL